MPPTAPADPREKEKEKEKTAKVKAKARTKEERATTGLPLGSGTVGIQGRPRNNGIPGTRSEAKEKVSRAKKVEKSAAFATTQVEFPLTASS